MTRQPNLWGRLLCHLQGGVSADTLEAYRRASLAVYDMLNHVEQKRAEARTAELHAWAIAPATQAEMLCSWNAYALQSLGDQLLDADYEADPATVGYVPPVTAEQVLAFYSQVEGWLSRAQQAHSNPTYQLDVAVPADLPPWSKVEPCPVPHLKAMLETLRALRDHADVAVKYFEDVPPPAEKQAAVGYARQLWAAASTKARYAEDLWGGVHSAELHAQIEQHAKEAIERLYRLGQLLAMPDLIEAEMRRGTATPTSVDGGQRRASAFPGQRDFDPWQLTDPATREQWQQDARARAAIADLWANDPNPDRTLQIQSEIDAAFQRGDITYATDRFGQRLGHFFCCPWSPVYLVKRPVKIGGKRLSAMQQFTFDVSAEGMAEGEPFKREILAASFEPTRRVDYCDTTAGDHD